MKKTMTENQHRTSTHMIIAAALLIINSFEAAAGECICQYDVSSRRLSSSGAQLKPVTFSTAEVTGENFYRWPAPSQPHIPEKKKRHRQPYFSSSSMVESSEDDGNTGDDGCDAEQVHISLGDSLDAVVIAFASPDFNVESKVEYSEFIDALMTNDESATSEVLTATGYYRAYSELLYTIPNLEDPTMGAPTATTQEVVDMLDTKDWAYDHKTGQHYSNWYNVTEIKYEFGQYNNPDFYYNSPLLHKVPIAGLSPSKTYFYRVSGSCEIFNFTTPPFHFSTSTEYPGEFYPFSMGLTGDVGLTEVSIKSLAALQALQADVVLLVGDLSYADGWQYSWDTWGDAAESLASHVPLMTTDGNHETGFGENNVAYYLRYATPYVSSASPDPGYWGREMGPVHVVSINSYAGYAVNSIQYDWLNTYLSTRVNRERTPWLVVMMHTPWYNSNIGHWKEGEKLRANMESLFNKYGVDIAISGHVHSYERSTTVFNETFDPCGTTYLNLGDGGNYEGYSGAWRMPAPEWSQFREASFGVGELIVTNDTHAYFSWHRHACQSDDPENYNMNFSSSCSTTGDNSEQAMETSDQVWIVRPSKDECKNKYISSDYEPVDPSLLVTGDDDNAGTHSGDDNDKSNDSKDDDSGNNKLSTLSIALIAACGGLVVLNGIMGTMYIIFTRQGRKGGSSSSSSGQRRRRKSRSSVGGESSDAKFQEYRGGATATVHRAPSPPTQEEISEHA